MKLKLLQRYGASNLLKKYFKKYFYDIKIRTF